MLLIMQGQVPYCQRKVFKFQIKTYLWLFTKLTLARHKNGVGRFYCAIHMWKKISPWLKASIRTPAFFFYLGLTTVNSLRWKICTYLTHQLGPSIKHLYRSCFIAEIVPISARGQCSSPSAKSRILNTDFLCRQA